MGEAGLVSKPQRKQDAKWPRRSGEARAGAGDWGELSLMQNLSGRYASAPHKIPPTFLYHLETLYRKMLENWMPTK